jgi:predicted DNA-binding transcriptional regulator YafY
MTLARACRDHEHVSASYVDRAGNATERRLEPYQLVTTGKRWYVLAYDRDREDWRSLRLDRMHEVRARGTTFVARDAPDAAAYVRRSISASPYRYIARVRYFAPESVVSTSFSPSSVTIEPDGPDACIVTAGADDPERMVYYFATVGADFEVLEPPEVASAVQSVAARLRRAASSP